jgi:hypothetical protein
MTSLKPELDSHTLSTTEPCLPEPAEKPLIADEVSVYPFDITLPAVVGLENAEAEFVLANTGALDTIVGPGDTGLAHPLMLFLLLSFFPFFNISSTPCDDPGDLVPFAIAAAAAASFRCGGGWKLCTALPNIASAMLEYPAVRPYATDASNRGTGTRTRRACWPGRGAFQQLARRRGVAVENAEKRRRADIMQSIF